MKHFRILAALVALFAPAFVSASEPEKIQFTEETLPNGLHVIYAPLRQAPVVHVRVHYHVGSRDERPDRQGFAHMFEHMMFRGSAHVAPEEHMKRIGTVGGYSNAFTSFDQTVYIDTVPSNYLDMALWLEADRMSSFKVSDEIYQTERKVVAEEWRMKYNRPYGSMWEDFLGKAFTTHSYRWTPIGDMEHLKNARVNELQDFFNTYYLPNNATLVIAGDFDLDATKQMVKRYYGWIPSDSPQARKIPAEPEQTERRVSTLSQRVPLPAVLVGYKVEGYKSDDHYTLSVLDSILGDGQSSRLYRRLVANESPLAVSAFSMHMQLEDYGLFGVGATVLQGKDPQQVREIIDQELARVVKEGVTAKELQKAKTQLRVRVINSRKTAKDLAEQLGEESLFGGDANRVNEALAKLDAVTPEQVKAVAAKYFDPAKATVLNINPDPQGGALARVAATKAAEVAQAPVKPATAPVKPRVVEFPKDYPTTAPGGEVRANPEFAKGVESNVDGVKVIVMPDPRLPLVDWSLTMRRGSQSDPKGKEGVAWLASQMLHRGVEGMTFEQLSRDLDERGISIDVGDGGDYTRLSGSCTSDQLDHAIKRSHQILLSPTFPQEEFEKLKEQSLNALQLEQETPAKVAGNELTTALYGDTPIGRYATPRSVESISLEDVKAFYKQIYKPNEAILIISGDVTVERGQDLAKQLIADWKPGELPAVKIDLPEHSPRRRIILVDRPEGKQATVRMGIRAYDIRSADKFPGSIAGQILTSGIDSRLGKYVRATKGLAYGVHGVFQPNRQAGAFIGNTDTAVESTADAVEAMFKVFDDMRKENVTDQELADAKKRVAGGMVMAVQTIDAQAGYRVDGILNDYPIDYYDKYPARIAEVKADEIRDVMNKYVRDGELTIIVVAPAAAVKQQLERLGDVEVVPMPSKREVATTQPLKKAA